MELRTSDGVDVWDLGLMLEGVYISLHMGSPSDFANAIILDGIQRRIEKSWGECAIYRIKPILRLVDMGGAEPAPLMPYYWAAVWLNGQATDGQSDGSELVVIFFLDDPYSKPMSEVLREVVSTVDWKNNCRNFDL